MFSRVRNGLSAGYDRLRTSVWSVVQAAVAASLAYFLAEVVIGHGQPFFAPIAAVICLSVTLGQRNRRAVELVFGVAVGLMVADLLVLVIGNGTLQIAVVVLLAMAAVFFGRGTMLVNQAAVSAVLVVVLQSPDAVFDELVAVLEEISAVLESGGEERAERVLERTREIDGRVRTFNEALEAGHETARLSPTRRRSLRQLEFYGSAGIRIELAVINTRVLARGVYNAIRQGDRISPQLPEAVLDLSQSVKALEDAAGRASEVG